MEDSTSGLEGRVSIPVDRLQELLASLLEMAARAEKADPIAISENHDELDAIAFTFNVLLAELKFASEAKSAFIRTISHEIRTPTTVLVGSAEMLARDDLAEVEKAALADRIQRAGRALLGLVDNVMDLAKIESGTLEVADDVVRLSEAVADVEAAFSAAAAKKGLRLDVDPATGIAPFAGDPRRVRQVLMNLVGNAVKYTDRGHVEVRVGIVEGDVNFLRITVADTGPGIRDDELDSLFRLYGRGAATSRHEGTGIGLHLARSLAEAMRGELLLAWSVPGEGSRFEFRLPWVRVPERRVDRREPTESPKRLAGRRILVVDDNPDIRELLQMMLAAQGATTLSAGSGKEAIGLALAAEFDVILMDLRMPRMSGMEAIQELRKAGYARPVIALTADALRNNPQDFRAEGFDGYLTKPVTYDVLVTYVAQFDSVAADTILEPPPGD